MGAPVRITSVGFSHVTLDQSDTSWKISLGTISGTLTTVIRLTTDDGYVGYGAAPIGAQLISGESHASVENFLHFASAALIGEDPRDRVSIMTSVDRTMAGNQRAKAGVDAALCDLVGRVLDVPAAYLLGGVVRRTIPVLRLMSVADPETSAKRAGQLVADGYAYLKIKLDGNIAADVDRVAAIRDACGTDVHLMVDANQAYTSAGAVTMLRAIEPYVIDMVEQPVPADDFDGLAMIRSKCTVPVEADESISTLGDALRLIQAKAVDYMSLKVGHLGGISRAHKLAVLCEAASIGCLVGANTGGRLVEAAHMNFIAASAPISYACEVGEFYRLTRDPTGQLECENGLLHLPPGSGVGVTPDPSLEYIELSQPA